MQSVYQSIHQHQKFDWISLYPIIIYWHQEEEIKTCDYDDDDILVTNLHRLHM